MTTINLNTTVGELVAERPARARAFEKYGIDYCCGGKKRLSDVCVEKGLDLQGVAAVLSACDAGDASDETDWTSATLTELADHIGATHHAYLCRELPRLAQLLAKIAHVHGERHPEMIEVERVFAAFRSEIDSHMTKEEQVLFPMIRTLEASKGLPSFHCGSINNPIRMMEMEHDAAGDALARMRELTGNYTPPMDACNTFRAALDGLGELEADMHRHVHKENSILFPRASTLEASRQCGSAPAGESCCDKTRSAV